MNIKIVYINLGYRLEMELTPDIDREGETMKNALAQAFETAGHIIVGMEMGGQHYVSIKTDDYQTDRLRFNSRVPYSLLCAGMEFMTRWQNQVKVLFDLDDVVMIVTPK